MQKLAELRVILHRPPTVGDVARLFRMSRDADVVVSEAPADARRCLQRREPLRPGPELTLATVVLELAQEDDQRIAGGLSGQIVDVAPGERRQIGDPETNMERGLAAQSLVELGDRPVADGLRSVQTLPPRLRL